MRDRFTTINEREDELRILALFLVLGLTLLPALWAETDIEPANEQVVSSEVRGHSTPAASLLGVIPGAGQFYNRQPIRAVLFMGAAGTLVTFAMIYQSRAEARRDEYNAEVLPAVIPALVHDFNAERDRNKGCWQGLVGLMAISALDAYICGWQREQALKVSLAREDMEVGYAIRF